MSNLLKIATNIETYIKGFLVCTILLLTNQVSAQTEIPYFLQGTWKIENKDAYEHWDILNEQSMKGLSYKKSNDEILVAEYLEISQKNDAIVYTASVLNQNQGNSIEFRLSTADGTYVFENPNHDFPKMIAYKRVSDSEVMVRVSDGSEQGFSYKMHRLAGLVSGTDAGVMNPHYDDALAAKLGADDYGMKGFILVMLKTGTNQTTDNAFIRDSFRGHLDNINRLVEAGKLIVAGPLGANEKTYRGIFILNASNVEEAAALLLTDPAIKEGLLDYELYNWYGSAALPAYLEYSDRIWKLKP